MRSGGADADLTDTAALLVSEVVTNAVIHAATEVEVACRMDARAVHVEVRDRSTVIPGVRHYDQEAMTGRGLGLVETLATGWGVRVEPDGKTVWFQLSVEPDDDLGGPAGVQAETTADVATFSVRLEGLPVPLVISTVQHSDTVLREVALLSLAEDAEEPGQGIWPGSGIDLGPVLEVAEQARSAGAATIDADVEFPAGAGQAAWQRLALVDEADRMAGEGLLLSSPPLPEVALCRRWMLGLIVLQEQGAAATRWELPAPSEPLLRPGVLTVEQRRRLDTVETPALVADDGNRIIHANGRAAAALGYTDGELAGRRLLTIVPPEFREAHLAGFMRYLLTGTSRILDRPVHLPALRQDGSRLDVVLIIRRVELRDRRIGFWAEFTPAADGRADPAAATRPLKHARERSRPWTSSAAAFSSARPIPPAAGGSIATSSA